MPYALHPRKALYQRYWARRKEARRRLRAGVLASFYPRPESPPWSDYFPIALGTVAEKMVFAALAAKGVTFFFSPYWGDIPFTEDKYERYRPDFVLPEYRIIIEVFGYYWHAIPGAAKKDATRAAMYTASGYTYYELWDYEIFENPFRCLDKIPELVNPAIRTGRVYLSERPFDPTASLRAQRRRYPKVVRAKIWGTFRSDRGVAIPLRAPRRVLEKKPTEIFGGLTPEDVTELQDYGKKWKKYVKDLGNFFRRYPSLKGRYAEQYNYWAKWRGYWTTWQTALSNPPDWTAYIKALGAYFTRYPRARYLYISDYYRWLSWRRRQYRRM